MEWRKWVGKRKLPDPQLMMPSGTRLLGYLKAHEEAGVPVDPELIRATGTYDSAQAREQTMERLRSIARRPRSSRSTTS